MTPPVGLYSIGMNGLDVSQMLDIAAGERVPYLHLRGGPRGCNLARLDSVTVGTWAREAHRSVPISVVTSDIEVSAFFDPGTAGYRKAYGQLSDLADAVVTLGARSIRLLGRVVPDTQVWKTLSVPDLAASHGLLTLIELHDPGWFTSASVSRLCGLLDSVPGLRVLLDTGQAHTAQLAGTAPSHVLTELARRSAAMHISDAGTGLDGTGHRAAARAVIEALADGNRIEVAFEWTGRDRSADRCIARYREALEWWQREWETIT